MKALLLIATLTTFSMIANAREPKATLCGKQAQRAALGIFKVNAPNTKPVVQMELIAMDHSEGGVEVWDVIFTDKKGNVQYSPYRMGVYVDGCTVYSFSMPTAG